jgi:hypothetical protein
MGAVLAMAGPAQLWPRYAEASSGTPRRHRGRRLLCPAADELTAQPNAAVVVDDEQPRRSLTLRYGVAVGRD